MARVQIEVTSAEVTSVVVLERVIQAADGRIVEAGHPDGARLAASEGVSFTLADAVAAGLVETVDGAVVGAEIEPVPQQLERPRI